jgi:hypothetical protein
MISDRSLGVLIFLFIAIGSQIWWNHSTRTQQNLEASERLQTDITNWLSPLDYSQKQNDLFGLRYPGTGEWLLESSEFNDWLSGPNHTLLLEGMRMSYNPIFQ